MAECDPPLDVIVPPAYITIDQANEFSARVANIAAWSTASSDQQAAALIQASDEIDTCQFDGIPYGDWRSLRPGTQQRAFPRIVLDDPANWPAGKLQESAIIYDLSPNTGEVIIPIRVRFATFLQALEILAYPNRKDRLRDRDQGVVSQSAAKISENYDAGKPVKLICMEAQAQLIMYLRKGGRIT